jgi:hypothetical protein
MNGKPSCVRSESKRARSFASTQLTKPKKKPRPDVSFPVSDVAAFVMTAISEIVEATKGKIWKTMSVLCGSIRYRLTRTYGQSEAR